MFITYFIIITNLIGIKAIDLWITSLEMRRYLYLSLALTKQNEFELRSQLRCSPVGKSLITACISFYNDYIYFINALLLS